MVIKKTLDFNNLLQYDDWNSIHNARYKAEKNANNHFKKDPIHVCARLPAVIIVILVTVFKIQHFIDQTLRFFPHISRQSTNKSKRFKNSEAFLFFSNVASL
jgi:hypothetical protein